MPNFKETKKIKASILVVTLMMIGIVLAVALTISLAAIRQRQGSLGANKSTGAFQNADSGIEIAMNEITRGTSNTVGDVCTSGVLTSSSYTVKLFDATGAELKCGDLTATSKSKWSIASIKSVGANDNQEQRAIEAVVASGLNWTEVSVFDHNWKNFGGGLRNAGYALDPRTGLVYLRGIIKDGSLDCAFYLPDGYKPSGVEIIPALGYINAPYTNSANAHAAVRIDIDNSTGCVNIAPYSEVNNVKPSVSWVSLDGIVFSTN